MKYFSEIIKSAEVVEEQSELPWPESPELLNEARHGRHLIATRDAAMTQVMKEILHFGSVDQTGQDHIDYKEVSVWNVRRALSVAFDKGYKFAQTENDNAKKKEANNTDPNQGSKDVGAFVSTKKGQ